MGTTLNTPKLVALWSHLIGEPTKSATQRARQLRLADLLPPDSRVRDIDLNDEHLARYVLAQLAAEQHIDGPGCVRTYWNLPVTDATIDPAPLGRLALGPALVRLLRDMRSLKGVWMPLGIQVTTTWPCATITLQRRNSDSAHVQVAYGTPRPGKAWPMPIERTRHLHGAAFILLAHGGDMAALRRLAGAVPVATEPAP